MPMFFNAGSHVWIAYLFFFNGLLMSLLLRSASVSFRRLSRPFESLIVFAFVMSISFNGALLLALDWLNIEFYKALWSLIIFSISLISWFIGLLIKDKQCLVRIMDVDWSVARLIFYALVFVVLFYNGGMIDQLSDAWWHMSLVNKMAMANSFDPELGHLTGAPARYYPPLWHSNLALAHLVSGDSVPVIWNSFTAWGAMIKVMAFYCFAYALTQNIKMASLAAVLFVLLPGIGNSYLRVSAWPSHVAYTVWYLMLFVFFMLVHSLKNNQAEGVKVSMISETLIALKDQWVSVFIVFSLATVVFFAHKTELLWFAVVCFTYLASVSIFRAVSGSVEYLAYRGHGSLRLTYRLMLLVIIAIAVYYTIENIPGASLDQTLSSILPLLILFCLLSVELEPFPRKFKIGILIFTLITIFASIDITHLLSLFFPEMSVTRGTFVESPSSVQGHFGGALDLPGWHLQLRSGLLFSGILALPLSVVLVILKPNAVSVFLSATSFLALIFCLSPYLYHWLKDILGYHSPWRIASVIFHPIVLSVCIVELWHYLKFGPKNAITS